MISTTDWPRLFATTKPRWRSLENPNICTTECENQLPLAGNGMESNRRRAAVDSLNNARGRINLRDHGARRDKQSRRIHQGILIN